MSVLKDCITTYSGLLESAPASLKKLPKGASLEDLPRSDAGRAGVFTLRILTPPYIRSRHGGGRVEYGGDLKLTIRWDNSFDEDKTDENAADDLVNAIHTMVKDGNKPTGVKVVNAPSGGTIEDTEDGELEAVIPFEVIWVETQDTT